MKCPLKDGNLHSLHHGVESADKERDAIFITRYHFQKKK